MTFFLKIPVFMSVDLSADIMASLCGIRISSKTSRPRDMLFFLKIPYLSRMINRKKLKENGKVHSH